MPKTLRAGRLLPARRRLALAVVAALTLVTLPIVLGPPGTAPPAAAQPRTASVERAEGRPNIVLITADDMRADDLVFMPRTRKLLVRQGLRFDNSFAPNPLCCPSRASLLSGRLSHNHKVFSHSKPWGFKAFKDRYTMPTALKESGYKTAMVGKYLNGYGKQPSRVTGRPSLRYVPKGYTDWYGALELPRGTRYRGGTYQYDNILFNHNGQVDDRYRGSYSTNVIGGISRRLIKKYAGGAKPFFVYASFVAPHHGGPAESDDPWMPTPARPRWVRGKFDALVKRAPGIPRDGGKVEADISDKPRFMRRVSEPGAPTRRALREVTRQRGESLYVLDGQIKAIARTLRNAGEWRNTVLMFTSDNGYLLGEHRQRLAKIKGHEPSIRVPFLVTGPGMRSGQRRTDPITTVDVTATILDLAKATGLLTARHSIDGASRVPTMKLGDQGWTTPVVTEGHLWPRPDLERGERHGFTGAGRSYIGLRTARYSLIRYITGALELYDHQDDANQMTSRHDDPAYRPVKRQLVESWNAYKDCRGASCQVPLPAELQADPTTAQELTTSFWRQVDAVHGY